MPNSSRTNPIIPPTDTGLAETFASVLALGIGEQELNESLQILNNRRLLNVQRDINATIYQISVPPHCLDDFLQLSVPDYEERRKAVIAQIVNHNAMSNWDIAKATGLSTTVVDHILSMFHIHELITACPLLSGYIGIHNVSPELKRML